MHRRPTWIDGPALGSDERLWATLDRACTEHASCTAISDASGSLTYAELRAEVERVADLLAAAGAREGYPILLAGERSVAEVVCVLAAVRAGMPYVALDTAWPARFTAYVEENSGARLRLRWDASGCLDDIAVEATGAAPGAPATPEPLAYVCYTSGSTGLPKGVRIPERAVARLVAGADYALVRPGDGALRLAPLAFDASTLELFVPLSRGAHLQVFDPGPVDLPLLAEFLHQREVRFAWLTAGLFAAAVDADPTMFAGLRQVVTGGDAVSPAHVRRLRAACPGVVVTNGYGPTENTTFTTVHSLPPGADVPDPFPIGTPVAGTSVALGDDDELLVRGTGLAVDYLGLPDLTAERFPVVDGERTYRTGDRARLRPDGVLEFVERLGEEVKVAGHLVDPRGVQRLLREHPGVSDCCVLLADGPGSALLAAYAGEPGLEPSALADRLRAELPAAAVPSRWMRLDTLPLSPNGKVDRAALRELAASRVPEVPRGAAEQPEKPVAVQDLVARSWAHALKAPAPASDVGFFEAGGDSLGLAQLHTALVAAVPESGLRLVDLFELTTIAAQAEFLRARVV